MPDLRDLLRELETSGELLEINDELSPRFEIPYVMKELDGRAIIFKRVSGFAANVFAGACSSRKRILRAIGISNDSLYSRLLDAINNPRPPRTVADGPVSEVIEEPNLHKIPVLTHFERDPGPYFTSAIVAARTPDGVENVSFHRLLVLDEKRLAIRIVPRHLHRIVADTGGKPLPVSISLGVHPGISLAVSCSAPYGVSEFGVANSLMGGGLRLIECGHSEVYAPADSELVLEGWLHPEILVDEGPFVDISGTYDVVRRQPVVEVTRVLHRRDYVYQALLPGGLEHRILMGMPKEPKIFEFASNVVPRVKAVNLTPGGCGYFHAIISIEKQNDGDAKNVIMACFSADPSLKHVVVVDTDIDVFNLDQVEWAIATRVKGDEDLLMVSNTRVSSLDPASDQSLQTGCKVGVDATVPFTKPKEKFELPKIPTSDRAERTLASVRR
jgi:UbiD family decarboxylase